MIIGRPFDGRDYGTMTAIAAARPQRCRENPLLGGLPKSEPDERVEIRVRAKLILGRIDRGARLGGLEPEVGKRGQGIGGGSDARSRTCSAERNDAKLALKLIGDARGKLRPDAVGAADHRLVVLGHRTRELVGRKRGKNRQRDLATDALNTCQGPKAVALGGRAEAEQRPRVLAHLKLGQDQDFTADRPQGIERAPAALDEIADSADVDHRALSTRLCKSSGKSCDHCPTLAQFFVIASEAKQSGGGQIATSPSAPRTDGYL